MVPTRANLGIEARYEPLFGGAAFQPPNLGAWKGAVPGFMVPMRANLGIEAPYEPHEWVAPVALRPVAARSASRTTQSRFKVPKRGPLAKEAPHGGRGRGTWRGGLARVESGYGFSGKSRACVILNA